MRHFLLALVLLALVLLAFAAQTKAQQSVKIPFEVFPIMGMNFGGDNDSLSIERLKEAYINGLYNGPALTHYLTGGMRAIPEFDSLDTPGNPLIHSRFVSNHMTDEEPDPYEWRCFLADNNGYLDLDGNVKLADYAHDLRIHPNSVSGIRSDNNEWWIGKLHLNADTAGHIMLSDLSDDVPITGRADSFRADFIYRLDTDAISTGGSLFVVEWYGKISSPRDVLLGRDTITSARFNAYLAASHPDENKNILYFPSGRKPFRAEEISTTHPYAVTTRWFTNKPGGHLLDRIYCDVKRLVPRGIFIRGARIRTPIADRILTGDPAIDSALPVTFRPFIGL